MNQQIHCIVNDCHYWSQGNRCVANKILVTTDNFGVNQPDRVDVNMVTQLTPQGAGTCMDTCCKTYVSKDSKQINNDSVQKMK